MDSFTKSREIWVKPPDQVVRKGKEKLLLSVALGWASPREESYGLENLGPTWFLCFLGYFYFLAGKVGLGVIFVFNRKLIRGAGAKKARDDGSASGGRKRGWTSSEACQGWRAGAEAGEARLPGWEVYPVSASFPCLTAFMAVVPEAVRKTVHSLCSQCFCVRAELG